MRADLSEQIRELMDTGLRPVSMADIQARPPARVPMRHRVAARFRPGPRRIIVAGAAGAAAAAVVITAATVSIASQGGRPLPSPSKGAVQLLARVAAVAARQPAVRVRDSQYMYAEVKEVFRPYPPKRLPPRQLRRDFERVRPQRFTEQIWMPVSDVCRTGLERTISPGGHASNAPFSARGTGQNCPNIGGLNDATYRLLQTLPTRPRALLSLIYQAERGHGPSADQEAFVTIGDLLRDKIEPPEVTAALYRAAALIPGVTLIPHATDAIGRHGIAAAQTIDGIRTELIFSQTTLRLIGESTTSARIGITTDATAIIRQAFVSHLGQAPPGQAPPR